MGRDGLSGRQALARADPFSSEPSSNRRAEILKATCRIISRVGLAEASLESVAAEAGISRPLVYYYFHSRDQLLAAAFSYLHHQMDLHTLTHMPAGTALEQVEHVLLAELQDVEIVKEVWRVWSEVAAAGFFNAVLRRSSNEAAAGWVEMVADLIRRGQAEGSIAKDIRPTDAAEILTAVVDALGTKWMLGGISATRARRLVSHAVHTELTSVASES